MGAGRKAQTFTLGDRSPSSLATTNISATTRNLRKENLGGVVFGCKNNTMKECLSKQIFGLPSVHFSYVKKIEQGLPLFLFNYSDRKLHGIYEAAGPGQMNINPYGWTEDGSDRTPYPAQVAGPVISLVSSILRKGEDDLTQLYALRTIENVCSQGGNWAARFTSQDVINNLCYIFKTSGKQENTRLTARSCLVRLVRFNAPSIQPVIEKLSFKETASALVKGSTREQQISLNLLNMALLGSHLFTNIGRQLLPLKCTVAPAK